MYPDEQDNYHAPEAQPQSGFQPGVDQPPQTPDGQFNQIPQPGLGQPQPQQPSVTNAPETSPKPGGSGFGPDKKKFIMVGVAAGLVALIIVVVVIAAMSSKPAPKQTPKAKHVSTNASGPAPATSDSIQDSDSRITQYLSDLNQIDFPSDKLSDKNLGLN